MQSTPNIGALITDTEAERDAIHIAVAPVIAGDYLNPGQWIRLTGGDYVRACNSEPHGVVDPFLKGSVKRGERFYMFLMPNTITSLRHDWTHPEFPPKPSKQTVASVSEAWLRAFADDFYIDYDEMMEDVANALNRGDDCLGCLGSSMEVNYDKFWHHYQQVTGQEISDSSVSDKWFRCAC